MRLLPAAIGVILAAVVAAAAAAPARTAHDFAFTSIDGDPLPLRGFAGKALLVVNTASLCGFTYQYTALQELWEGYRERGLVVLGVPSNDFGNQEPGTEAEIKEFCEVNFAVDFPMTAKQQVRGADAHPFFQYVGDELGADAAPRWNFHKYLVTPDGRLAGAWPSRVEPGAPEIRQAIEAALPD
jgi:glutathione peroxidase